MRPNVGERLLTSKLQILSGSGARPSTALSILTGRVVEQPSIPQRLEVIDELMADPLVPPPAIIPLGARRRRYAAYTVYLSERNLRDLQLIVEDWRQHEHRHMSRSAVVRRALEHLRRSIEADPTKNLLENND